MLEVLVVNVLIIRSAVEEQKNDSLEGRHHQLLESLGKPGFDLAMGERVLELQLATRMLDLVVCFKFVDRRLDLRR